MLEDRVMRILYYIYYIYYVTAVLQYHVAPYTL